jgi:hypothetical protein
VLIFDDLSVWLTVASIILGFLTIVIVGSQTREDAWSIVVWSLGVLVPVLLVSCVRLALAVRTGAVNGGPGMVVLSFGGIAALGVGYRLAASRRPNVPSPSTAKPIEPGLSDDELA